MTPSTQCSLEMLVAALEMEEKGKVFYQKAADSCQNPWCREIFSTLAEEEVIHSRRIKQIHEKINSAQCWTKEWETIKGSHQELGALFRKLAAQENKKIKAETSDLEAVDIGLDFESASLQFYQDHRTKTVDPIEAAFLDQMILEERKHQKALEDTRYYLTDPEGWFMEREHAGLDGA
jgi:rubrerythrin